MKKRDQSTKCTWTQNCIALTAPKQPKSLQLRRMTVVALTLMFSRQKNTGGEPLRLFMWQKLERKQMSFGFNRPGLNSGFTTYCVNWGRNSPKPELPHPGMGTVMYTSRGTGQNEGNSTVGTLAYIRHSNSFYYIKSDPMKLLITNHLWPTKTAIPFGFTKYYNDWENTINLKNYKKSSKMARSIYTSVKIRRQLWHKQWFLFMTGWWSQPYSG